MLTRENKKKETNSKWFFLKDKLTRSQWSFYRAPRRRADCALSLIAGTGVAASRAHHPILDKVDETQLGPVHHIPDDQLGRGIDGLLTHNLVNQWSLRRSCGGGGLGGRNDNHVLAVWHWHFVVKHPKRRSIDIPQRPAFDQAPRRLKALQMLQMLGRSLQWLTLTVKQADEAYCYEELTK